MHIEKLLSDESFAAGLPGDYQKDYQISAHVKGRGKVFQLMRTKG